LPWIIVGLRPFRRTRNKKADAIKYPEACDRVGLLVNKPPGTAELLFI
jgi:hypothetical protein